MVGYYGVINKDEVSLLDIHVCFIKGVGRKQVAKLYISIIRLTFSTIYKCVYWRKKIHIKILKYIFG